MPTPIREGPASQTPKPGLECFTLGPFDTNCYVISPLKAAPGSPCWIVDASFEPRPLIESVRNAGMTPEALILTHTHVDHIAGVREVLAAFPGLPLLVHGLEREWLQDPLLNLSAMGGQSITTPEPNRLLSEGDVLVLGSTTWRVLHTPGHSPGGITLYHEPSATAIVGDSLFSGSIGRTDFPGGDHATLERAIRQKLYTLPDHVAVLPGHGPATTIGREKRSNPYVRG